MQQLELIRGVPYYDKDSKFPWLHRLTQLCDSTRSAWMDEDEDLGGIRIIGPFARKFGRIRSVHFALPRSLPRSLSRGIKRLDLHRITLRRFEDLTHLVCELPDLEELDCDCDNLDPPPIELPRRPRTNRNKLSKVRIWTDEDEFLPVPSTLMLFLSVYAAPSFFSEGELAVVLALLQLLVRPRLENESLTVRYEDHPHDHSRKIGIYCCSLTFLWPALIRFVTGPSFIQATSTTTTRQSSTCICYKTPLGPTPYSASLPIAGRSQRTNTLLTGYGSIPSSARSRTSYIEPNACLASKIAK